MAMPFPGDYFAYSCLKIPSNIDKMAVCDIKRETMLADLVSKTSLTIWDKALMTHWNYFKMSGGTW
jgi:hypothetical protein